MATEEVKPILVIDDDPDVRDALATVLEDEGYLVIPARHGAEGLDKLKQGPEPGLILLDLMMPVMDGYAFRAAQQENPSWAGIPVLVITAGTMEPRAQALGDATIRKPVDLATLLRMVSTHGRFAA